MNILFLGTSDFAVPVLDMLHESDHEVALVVTAPDRPKGRGRKVDSPPIAQRARALGVDLFQPARIRDEDAFEHIAARSPDLTVVVAYGQILRKPVLELAPKGIVNLHGSLLPALRGAAPIARAIQQGMTETGVTLQHVVREVDAGDVIDAEPMKIGPMETAGEASERMSRLAAELLKRNLDRLDDGTAPRIPQVAQEATFAPMLAKHEGRIPWDKTAREIHDHVRAMTPWPSAFTELVMNNDKTERLVLRKTEPRDGAEVGEAPGTVIAAGETIDVATGAGILRIHRLLRSGRSEMGAPALLRGFPLTVGARLS